jgi:hypothetical protein
LIIAEGFNQRMDKAATYLLDRVEERKKTPRWRRTRASISIVVFKDFGQATRGGEPMANDWPKFKHEST